MDVFANSVKNEEHTFSLCTFPHYSVNTLFAVRVRSCRQEISVVFLLCCLRRRVFLDLDSGTKTKKERNRKKTRRRRKRREKDRGPGGMYLLFSVHVVSLAACLELHCFFYLRKCTFCVPLFFIFLLPLSFVLSAGFMFSSVTCSLLCFFCSWSLVCVFCLECDRLLLCVFLV